MKTRKRKFGFTLVEMSVALAVTAIMMIMISTLTITVFDQRATVEKQYNQSNEMTEITSFMQSWFDEFTVTKTEGSTFTVSDNDKKVERVGISGALNAETQPFISAETDADGNLVLKTLAPSGTTQEKTFMYIKDVAFSVPENAKDSIVMTIKYDSFDKSELSMRFLYCGKVFKNE